MARDIKIKRASYIDKNCELLQEFMFSHPNTRFQTNVIYNSHFTGSPIWDLFSQEAKMLENTWSVSVRRMFELPYTTHRYLIEPVSDHHHPKKILIKRFLSFIRQIRKSGKILPKQLLNVIQNDTRSIPGSNIRKILLLTKIVKLEEISNNDVEENETDVIQEENLWREELIKKITDIKFGQLHKYGFSEEECEAILNFACTSEWVR